MAIPLKYDSLKYELYELSVQGTEGYLTWFSSIFKDLHGKEALHMREDFCGTFLMSCEWVKLSPLHTVVCLDIDPEPLDYGKKKNLALLTRDQKKRVKIHQADVLVSTFPKKDLIIACNFSFFIFKTKPLLSKYFRSCLRSLNTQGALILEMAGGPGMITEGPERKTVKMGKGKKFTYIWDQKSFDPITYDAQYAIHFKLSPKKMMRDVFTYDWRLWTIPEIRDLLKECGFSKSHVYWETAHKGEGTGEFVPTEKADNAYAWIAYIVAVP